MNERIWHLNFAGNSWLSKKCCCIMQRSIAELSRDCPVCAEKQDKLLHSGAKREIGLYCSAKILVLHPKGRRCQELSVSLTARICKGCVARFATEHLNSDKGHGFGL